MKIIKTFSFWFVLVSLIVSYLNFTNQDDKGLLFFFFGLDPILYHMVYSETFRSFIMDESTLEILWTGYILRVAVGLLYGLTLNFLVYQVKNKLISNKRAN
ncbi:hypothetical protein A6395_10595 [Exiguobacterium sp. SH31]|nr:hypothetical protein A6395_10595 [Exiguobacterium sp. SH31]TCI69077.1 hypothetical protein EVJ22_11440 [Exiguobacterium sp. SH0S7]